MIVIDPHRLARIAIADLDALTTARQCVVAIGNGRISGAGAAALLMADYAAVEDRSTLIIDTPDGWAGVVWRIGDAALRVLRAKAGQAVPAIVASDARPLGLIDELFHGEWTTWLDLWLGHRSTAALDSAALLTARRGGDALERAEFARLFATGEPQHGLDAFLARRRPRFGER